MPFRLGVVKKYCLISQIKRFPHIGHGSRITAALIFLRHIMSTILNPLANPLQIDLDVARSHKEQYDCVAHGLGLSHHSEINVPG